MKAFVLLFALAAFIGTSTQSLATAKKSRAADSTTTVATQAVYVCPMHPEVTSTKPGTCPKCKMDLEKKEMKKPAGKKRS